jgi:hypothetical protein
VTPVIVVQLSGFRAPVPQNVAVAGVSPASG